MQFMVHITGAVSIKARVPAVPAVVAGVWGEIGRDIMRPCPDAVRNALPARLKRIYDAHTRSFWFDKAARFDGTRQAGGAAHMTLRDSRQREIATLYAVACADA